MMKNSPDSARALLDAAYNDLGLVEGELLDATDEPNSNLTTQQWIDKGDWLTLAKKVKAEKVFFVQNNPVIVFAENQEVDLDAMRRKFNEIWCMARPMLLFLAKENQLSVYDLANPPVRTAHEWTKRSRDLDSVRAIEAVASQLHRYRREQIESGRVFEDERFGYANQRADQSLIANLKLVRSDLRAEELDGEDLKYAHALIGRSIFIRYLEDRGILIEKYFRRVAGTNRRWQHLLESQSSRIDIDARMDDVLYFRVLQDKDFTYALFDALARDFNGDMFPTDNWERSKVKQKHLDLLRSFLQGQAGPQQNLFFWAYRFDIIPIALISSIYEEFYHVENEKKDGKGTHYTPASLVEFVVSQTLTHELLNREPRIIDVAAGSGIFLVECFRRIVRYHIYKSNGRRLNFRELQKILRDQIAGIEINEEAVSVAAFSLYLALLHYQEPPDILRQIEKGHRLPHLIYQQGKVDEDGRFNCLVSANAFDIEAKVEEAEIRRRFTSNCADVVLGNPPWGSPKAEDHEGNRAMEIALNWCGERNVPVSDKERSQAFTWRSLDLLRHGGVAGLLVSTGMLYKKLAGSNEFRKEWLKAVRLRHVVNFAHVRDVFFRGPNREVEAISPFASIIFEKGFVNSRNHLVQYWSAKKTAQVEHLQAVVLSQPDLHFISQDDLRSNSELWKIYWWGNHRDAALISSLQLYPPMKRFCDLARSGQGFSSAKKELEPTPTWLLKYDYLPASAFHRYGSLNKEEFCSVPKKLKRLGKIDYDDKGKPVSSVYDGIRLLIKHGITQTSEDKGQIIARVETDPFCVSNSINVIKLPAQAEDCEYKVLLGILWSSLARYYFFLTASKWGMWHFGIHKEEYLNLPIRFPEDHQLQSRICELVERLRAWNPTTSTIFQPEGNTPEQIAAYRAALEYDLDEAIFDLYRLSESERDLIRDMCDIGIEFFYRSFESEAVRPIRQSDHSLHSSGSYEELPSNRRQQTPLQAYLHTFLKIWNGQRGPTERFRWHVIQPEGDFPLLAVLFSSESKDEPIYELNAPENEEWKKLLEMLESELLFPYNTRNIYIDGMVRAVTDTSIIVIKRNEYRLWTRSMARDDAEATMVQVMNAQETGRIFSVQPTSPRERPPLVG